jgi:hypothetical protein
MNLEYEVSAMSEKETDASGNENQATDGTVGDMPPISTGRQAGRQRSSENLKVANPEDIQNWKNPPSGMAEEKERTENKARTWIAATIVAIFFIWAVGGGVYLALSGSVQTFITVGAFISGPFGIVIGYYFGIGDEKKK